MPLILESNLPGLELIRRGKVRDVYAVGADKLLIVASDRISAFDVILGSGIPDKGRILTQISLFWFEYLKGFVPNHLISANVDEYPAELQQYREQIEGRSMFVHRAKMVDVECVARGYISGSGWKDYKQTGAICGISLPSGLRESDRLPAPIFTPATKAQSGHDENISFETAAESIGVELATRLRDLTLGIYDRASAFAETRGIILADTKFEFGFVGSQLVLGDEVLTPDSSRFWPRASYAPGGAQPSYDKQFVRDYLESITWNKQYPGPVLPEEVVIKTREKYLEAYRVLTGRSL
ncbi:MAG: phosphoribosylaminoimidazolesuccinocarboxamide synthase [Acidobacteria bacterium]|nr:phosphoribosylaminoimidazolesuccinocarboxamide synthase [Acidobacteriota bacterium]